MAQAELESTAQEFRLDRTDRDFERTREIQQLLVEIEKQRMAIADRKALLAADESELVGHEAKLEAARQLRRNPNAAAISKFDYQDVVIAHNAVVGRIQGHKDYLKTADGVLKEQQALLARQEPAAVADVERALLPLRATVEFQKARIEELEAQLKLLTVRADHGSHHSDL